MKKENRKANMKEIKMKRILLEKTIEKKEK